MITSLPDPDWYLDHVVLARGPDGQTGRARRWQAGWAARARELGCQDEAAVRLALTQGFVVTRRQARSAGVPAARLRRLVRKGTWCTPRYGVLAVVPDTLDIKAALAATAAALARPGHVISHESAAVLHGLPLVDEPADPVLTAHRPSTLGRRCRSVVRSARLAPTEVTAWFGAPVTTIARTVTDIARASRPAGLVAADAALHEGLLTAAELVAAATGCAGWPGARMAREVAALASPLAESPLESLTRLCVLDARLPAPALQVPIVDPADGWKCRVDMLWAPQRVVLEADGRLKYTDRELWREKRRQHRLERLGYRVVRAIWDDVTAHPEELVKQLRMYLRDAPPPR